MKPTREDAQTGITSFCAWLWVEHRIYVPFDRIGEYLSEIYGEGEERESESLQHKE